MIYLFCLFSLLQIYWNFFFFFCYLFHFPLIYFSLFSFLTSFYCILKKSSIHLQPLFIFTKPELVNFCQSVQYTPYSSSTFYPHSSEMQQGHQHSSYHHSLGKRTPLSFYVSQRFVRQDITQRRLDQNASGLVQVLDICHWFFHIYNLEVNLCSNFYNSSISSYYLWTYTGRKNIVTDNANKDIAIITAKVKVPVGFNMQKFSLAIIIAYSCLRGRYERIGGVCVCVCVWWWWERGGGENLIFKYKLS